MAERSFPGRQVRAPATAALAAVVLSCAAPASPAAPGSRTGLGREAGAVVAGAVSPGAVVRVDVSVATLWVHRTSPRPVDRPALTDPADPAGWLRAMSTDDRLGLVGRVETQALYGDRLRVLRVRHHWLRVVALAQDTVRDPRGYPGWVPRRQVTTAQAARTASTATVVVHHTWLRDEAGARLVQVGYGTVLPVIAAVGDTVTTRTVTGARASVRRSAVAVAARGAPALPPTVTAVLDDARSFIGVPYLWGGRSGWAVDCSGFTGLVYAVHGVRLPRDAQDQATQGRSVGIAARRPGDLAFFDRGGSIGHVGFVLSRDRLLHAPGSGSSVSVVPLSSVGGLVAIRRYL